MFRGHSPREPAYIGTMRRVTYFMLRVHTSTRKTALAQTNAVKQLRLGGGDGGGGLAALLCILDDESARR